MTLVSAFRVDELEVRVFDSIEGLSAAATADAAAAIRGAIDQRDRANVMFASGNSQLAFLEELTARTDVGWHRVTGFHMDEYVGMDASHAASFARYMRERIVERAHPAVFHYLDGKNAVDEECARYAKLLR